MDVVYFLRERTKFIRYFHDTGCEGFCRIKDDIDAKRAPYEEPPFDPDHDDPEPPFLAQWLEADTGVQMVGIAAVSMLSDTLKIYFQTLKQEFAFSLGDNEKAFFKKHGFIEGYKKCLGEILSTDWTGCPVRFDIIEQVVLARNRAQHGDHLSILPPTHDKATIEKHPRPFFISESEKAYMERSGEDATDRYWLSLEIERGDLFRAIYEVETLADWIHERESYAREWHARMQAAREV